AGQVGAVVGATELRDDREHLTVATVVVVAGALVRAAAQDLAHAPDVLRGLLERDARGQRGANPEIALLQLRHELAAERLEEDEPEDDRHEPQREGELGATNAELEDRQI